jgi:hypothetical protein
VISATVLAFFLLIGFVFWITSLHDRPDFEERTSEVPHAPRPAPEMTAAAREAEGTS